MKQAVKHPMKHRTPKLPKAKPASETPFCGSGLDDSQIMFLANLWKSEPESRFAHEALIEHARILLGKYDLEPEELDEAAPLLAKALHMRLEQNGGQDLDEALKREIERQVLDWCRLCPPPAVETPTSKTPIEPPIEMTVRRPETHDL